MARVLALAPLVAFLLGLPRLAPAHEDEAFAADQQDPYVGEAWREADGGSPDLDFTSRGVTLRSWLPVQEFAAGATRGNTCWGYTSPSGREYALIGLDTGTGVAEVTDPGNTRVVAHLAGPTRFWRDIKT